MIYRHLGHLGETTIRPQNLELIYNSDFAQANGDFWIHAGLKASVGHLFGIKYLVASFHLNLCAYSSGVFSLTYQLQLDAVQVWLQAFTFILKDLGGCIDVVDHQVQGAVVVQIPISGSIGVDGFA